MYSIRNKEDGGSSDCEVAQEGFMGLLLIFCSLPEWHPNLRSFIELST